jgi:hypothetical protein
LWFVLEFEFTFEENKFFLAFVGKKEEEAGFLGYAEGNAVAGGGLAASGGRGPGRFL